MTNTHSLPVPPSADSSAQEQSLLAVVTALVRELHAQRSRALDVSMASRLDRDLGIDSLGRAELVLRVERAFHVRLPANTISDVETIGDLLQALRRAAPHSAGGPSYAPAALSLPSAKAPADARTLIDVLEWHATQHPDRLHLSVLGDDLQATGTMTYAQLAKAARHVAAGLIERDVVPGDRIALMLPTGLDFFAAFFGILYAGAVPVPIYPPARLSQLEEHVNRQAGILRNAGARILVTVDEALTLASLLRAQVETLEAVDTVAGLSTPCDVQLPTIADENATAFIQYTSGSTGDPKGVVLSHANLLANIRSFGIAIDVKSEDVIVSWLPLYHDFGLIAGWLGSLYFAATYYVMSPLVFLARPESWFWAIHRFRGTISGAPNFSFELCLGKINDEDIKGLDLSSLHTVANGAESVSVQTLCGFIKRFESYGFHPGAMAPAYGLAENTVALTVPPRGRPPLIDRVNREALTRRGVAEPAQPNDRTALEIVSCGRPLPSHDVRIVDQHGREVEERREGRLEFRGPSATAGYFRNKAKTDELFHDGWLDSGDQAYMAAGEVYVTGRVKDIIIRAGRHIYPQEIEEAVAQIPGLIRNGVAVFGMRDAASGTERTVIMAETAETDAAYRDLLRGQARDIATTILGSPPDEVVLTPPETVPKTSSGKIRRSAARELYESGRAAEARRTIRWQVVRLFLAGLGPRIFRAIARTGSALYAVWWWAIIAITAVTAWLTVMALPRLEWRWAAVRGLARAALAMLGARASVVGAEHLPASNAVVVFNHSSYADMLVVAAVLPGAPAFAAKKELASQAFAGPFLRRLGACFVDRYDIAGSLADTASAAAVARQGRLLVFFPEGTFSRRPGLTGFYLGAFKIAAEAGLPVVPGIIRGTRTMLRSDQWFPRWTPVNVRIAAPVRPMGADFSSVLQLRDEVREVMLAHCGEPDLSGLEKPAPPQATTSPAHT